MKLFFSVFLLFFLNQTILLAKNFTAEYDVKTRGFSIGKLFLELDIEKTNYEMSIELKNKGLFSGLYTFEGNYLVSGIIDKNKIYPTQYKQHWITRKKNRKVKIIFKKNKLIQLSMAPEEKELPRINYNDLEGYLDPLSSFLNILINGVNSKTVDGRRTYTLVIEVNKNSNEKKNKITVKDYVNIWADHKRNDLEYIEITRKKNKDFELPSEINIMFKKMLFKLNRN